MMAMKVCESFLPVHCFGLSFLMSYNIAHANALNEGRYDPGQRIVQQVWEQVTEETEPGRDLTMSERSSQT